MNELTALVTLKPCGEVTQATGVPRYNKLLKLVRQLVEGNSGVTKMVKEYTASIPKLVRDSINATAADAGNVTVPMVMAELERISESVTSTITNAVNTKVEAVMQRLQGVLPPPRAIANTTTAPSLNLNRGN